MNRTGSGLSIDLGDSVTLLAPPVVVPPSLEDHFLVNGPDVFRWLVERSGGRMLAELSAKISSSTMSRWICAKPGAPFPSGKMKIYQSIWFGYPTPFPGFDRIVEEISGAEDSFIGVSVREHGFARTMRWMRGPRGFGLEMLPYEEGVIREACLRIGIPAVTRRRWRSGLSYPTTWSSLDLLCMEAVGLSWLEVMLRLRRGPVPRNVSVEALRCLLDDALQMR